MQYLLQFAHFCFKFPKMGRCGLTGVSCPAKKRWGMDSNQTFDVVNDGFKEELELNFSG